ncbi:partial Lactose transport system permease protein LacF, partial [Anaerolineae bacterium]
LGDPVFIHALTNTIVYSVEVVILQVVVALILALLIRNYFPGIGIFRSAYFLPVMTSLVVVSTVWKIMYHTDNGLINSVVRTANLAPIPWLTSPDVALWSMVIVGVWKEVGFSMLVLLGGLQGIPQDLYEAGAIDGATGWNAFWKITLPLLRRAMLFVVVLATINAFKLFVPIYVMTEGGPADSTQSLVYYIYRSAFSYYKVGYASALSFILLIMVVILAAIQFRVFRSDVEY